MMLRELPVKAQGCLRIRDERSGIVDIVVANSVAAAGILKLETNARAQVLQQQHSQRRGRLFAHIQHVRLH
jgi:hypothetical protein